MRAVVISALAIPLLVGCGPMPGTAPAERVQSQPERTGDRQAPPRATPPREATSRTNGEAPRREDAPGPDEAHVEKIAIADGIYYLVDTRRELCFLREMDAVTQVDCARIPEARVLLGMDGAAPAATDPPAVDGEPTAEERQRFRGAYSDVFCARRRGEARAPADVLEDHDLTPERYNAVEAWMARDPNRWRAFTASVLESCPAAE